MRLSIIELRAKGHEVIDGEEAKKLLPYPHYSYAADHVNLDATAYTGKAIMDGSLVYVTFGEVIANMPDIKPKVIVNPHTGNLVQMITRDQADTALTAAGKASKSASTPSAAARGEEEARRQAQWASLTLPDDYKPTPQIVTWRKRVDDGLPGENIHKPPLNCEKFEVNQQEEAGAWRSTDALLVYFMRAQKMLARQIEHAHNTSMGGDMQPIRPGGTGNPDWSNIMSKFITTAATRETSVELMAAILAVACNDETVAEAIWEDGPTGEQLVAIVEIVTENGLTETTDYCWGVMGSRWHRALTA